MKLDDLQAMWDAISHGPCFPLNANERFGKPRIDDVHGNVVIEQPDIWLPEAAEYLVAAGNALPKLLAVARAASIIRDHARWDAIEKNEPWLPGWVELNAALEELEK